MTQVSPILRVWADGEGTQRVLYWCPGCKYAHHAPVNRSEGARPSWHWDGNVTEPTLSPSVRHFIPAHDGLPEKTFCHYHIIKGMIRYCGDCDHEFNAKEVPLPVLPPASDYGYPDER